MSHPPHRLSLLAAAALALAVAPGFAQQTADPDFHPAVAHPAYGERHPSVLFDEAHFNFHTMSGRYQPFTELIRSDGYQVTPNRSKFSPVALKGCAILVIANAQGAPKMGQPEAADPAFTDQECDAVGDWVHAGGSLLLIADHYPFGAAMENLARRFGIEMRAGFTEDSAHCDAGPGANPGWLVFSRANHLLADHPITQGRGAAERINRVVTFLGQSLKGPEGSRPLFQLADTATDRVPVKDAAGKLLTDAEGRWQLKESSAAGRTQGLTVSFGKGRVVCLGEAALLSAQIGIRGSEKVRFGMNRPGNDNRQLALNIMHWLSGLLN